MNLNLFGHDGQWIMIDCGVTFEETPNGNEVQMPDPQFIVDRVDTLLVSSRPMRIWIISVPCPI